MSKITENPRLTLQQRLASKIILIVGVMGLIFALFMSAVQLYTNYHAEIERIKHSFQQIEKNNKKSLTASLWGMDVAQIKLQLQGILLLKDIEYVSIESTDTGLMSVGMPPTSDDIKYHTTLVYISGDEEINLGTLNISASRDNVYLKLKNDILTILLSNVLLVFFISGIIVFALHYLVVKRIDAISQFALNFNSERANNLLPVRNAVKLHQNDEVDLLVHTMNMMIENLNITHDELKNANVNLEKKVAERTVVLEKSNISLENEIKLRKDFEVALIESKEKFHHYFAYNLVGMGVINKDGSWHEVNNQLSFLFGLDVNALQEKTWESLFYKKDVSFLAERFTDLFERKVDEFSTELQIDRPNGHVVDVELSASLIKDENNDADTLLLLLQDISSKKEAEKLTNEFVATVSHELRTPLSSIGGSLKIIQSGTLGEVSADVSKFVDIAKRNTDRLLTLVNDLLDFQKIIANGITFEFKDVSFKQQLKNIIANNQSYAEAYNTRLVFPSAIPDIQIHIDALRFEQVMANLISNACKFNKPDMDVEINSWIENDMLCISVVDHGEGIPEEFHERMFQQFSQANSSDTRRVGGTGLGLAISKQLVERMHGQIGFETEQGVGTTFWIKLPIVS